ncbi:MAG: metal ABC transporter permease [Pseudomonadota bacterium]
MLDDFFTRALLAGLGVALCAGPLGCFVIWRRLAYFGDTLAHAALLGAAFSLLLNVNLTLGVFFVAILVALGLIYLQARTYLASDAILGLLSHSALAVGLVTLSLITVVRVDLDSLLFGDILAVSRFDVGVIWVTSICLLAVLAFISRPLLAATVNPDLAQAEGVPVARLNLIFIALLAGLVAIAMQVAGVLLITALLIIPAATARSLAASPEMMALAAAVTGIIAVFGGMFASLQFDTPSGPSIVVGALTLFVVGLLFQTIKSGSRKRIAEAEK